MKRTPLHRKTPLRRATRPINPKSAKQITYDNDLYEARQVVVERSEGRCEFEGCDRYFEHVHHKLRRAQGGGNAATNLMACCIFHHEWIHLHPEKARQLGYLSRMGS